MDLLRLHLGAGEYLADSDNAGPLTSTYLSKRADLVRFFTVRTGSAAEAEDIVQEMFVKIVAVDPAGIENPAAFLYKLGSNVMLDRVRTRRRAVARDDEYFNVASAGARNDPAASDPSPEQAWRAKRRLEEVLRILDAFPPQRRRVFTMHKIDGLSYAEVADALGISKSAVEKHMMAALKTLAELAEP